MRYLFCLFLFNFANAGTNVDKIEGVYKNPSYGEAAFVEIRSTDSYPEVVFNVPCGSKTNPAIFRVHLMSEISGELELINEGGHQCYTGVNPKFLVLGNTIQIRSHPVVRTPGFGGVYELKR